MIEGINIVRAEHKHAAYIARAEKAYMDCPWTEEQVKSEIQNDAAIFLVALDGDKEVGYLSGTVAADECEISDIAVDGKYRRKGIATRLFEVLTEQAASRGAKSMFLLVRTDNAPAVGLYASLGFRRVGCRTGYYGSGKDAYIMRLDL